MAKKTYRKNQAVKPDPTKIDQTVKTPIYSTIVLTPPRREINDIGNWKSALRSADMGIRYPLYDLYTSILIDGTVTDAINKRIEAITDADINFTTADGKNVEEMEKLINSLEFERLLESIMWSRFWGVSVDEFTFFPEFDFNSIPRKHIRPKEKIIVRHQTDESGISYRDDDMVIQWGRDDDLGIILKIAPYVIYKRGGFGDWAQFVELFGMPIRIGKYNSMDDTSRRLLIEAFETAGSAPYLVVPKESEIETTLMSGTTNGALYDDFRKACNEEILITILGQTMTTQSGASLSQSQVHLAVQEKKHRSDRRFVIRQLNKYFVPLLEKRGYPVSGGQFTFVDKKDEISITDLKTLSGILPIPRKWAYEKYGIPEPQNDEPILEAIQPEPQASAPSVPSDPSRKTQEPAEPKKDPDTDDDPPVRNSDSLWKRIVRFFAEAPTGAGAGRVRMNDSLDDRVIRSVYEGEELFLPELFRYFSKAFIKGIEKGFKENVKNMDISFNAPDNIYMTSLETNLYHFSAGKTLAEIQALNELLRDSEGYADFRKKAAEIVSTFNDNWQEAEYNTAVLSAESARNYRYLMSIRNIYPYWQYRTMDDDRVRPMHRMLDNVILPCDDVRWLKIFPPNGWRCRCTVIALMSYEVKGVDFEEMRRRVDAYLTSAEWKKNEAQGWGVNRALEGYVFAANQMYIRKFPQNASSYLDKLKAPAWGADTAESIIKKRTQPAPSSEDDPKAVWQEESVEGRIIAEDYRQRPVSIDNKVYKDAVAGKLLYWDAVQECLLNPDEVWLNGYSDTKSYDTYNLIKYYSDGAIVVSYRQTAEEMTVTGIAKLSGTSRRTYDTYRRGLLIKSIKNE